MNRKHISFLLVLLIFISMMVTSAYAETLNASDVYYVTDNANVLSQTTVERIKNYNGALEQQCDGAQIVVATVKYTGGVDSDVYAMKLFNNWGIGSQDYNNGILILLVTEENKYYVQCGLGIDVDSLSDSLGSDLNKFETLFDNKEYDEAVTTLFDGMITWFDTQYTSSVAMADQYITNNDSYGSYGSGVDLFSMICTLIFLYIFFHAIIRSIRRTHYIRTGTWLPMFLLFGSRKPYWGFRPGIHNYYDFYNPTTYHSNQNYSNNSFHSGFTGGSFHSGSSGGFGGSGFGGGMGHGGGGFGGGGFGRR